MAERGDIKAEITSEFTAFIFVSAPYGWPMATNIIATVKRINPRAKAFWIAFSDIKKKTSRKKIYCYYEKKLDKMFHARYL